MKIKPSSREAAVRTGGSGLQFGQGPDLVLSEDLRSGRSNLGVSYTPPPGYQKDTAKIKNFLAGMENFPIDETEMFYAFGK